MKESWRVVAFTGLQKRKWCQRENLLRSRRKRGVYPFLLGAQPTKQSTKLFTNLRCNRIQKWWRSAAMGTFFIPTELANVSRIRETEFVFVWEYGILQTDHKTSGKTIIERRAHDLFVVWTLNTCLMSYYGRQAWPDEFWSKYLSFLRCCDNCEGIVYFGYADTEIFCLEGKECTLVSWNCWNGSFLSKRCMLSRSRSRPIRGRTNRPLIRFFMIARSTVYWLLSDSNFVCGLVAEILIHFLENFDNLFG